MQLRWQGWGICRMIGAFGGADKGPRQSMVRRATPAAKARPSPPDALEIARLLLQRYPDPKIALQFSNPLELLIAVILSAQCTDARVNEVTKTLFTKYRRAADY